MAGVLEKWSGATGGSGADFHAEILACRPSWESMPSTTAHANSLKMLDASATALVKKGVIQGDENIMKAAISAIATVPEDKPVQYILTVFYDMLREDSSTFSVFEEALKKPNTFQKSLVSVIKKPKVDQYIADKAAWLLTAVIGNVPSAFNDAEVQEVASALQRPGPDAVCSDLGVLEAFVNLLKADAFRQMIWKTPGVSERVMAVSPSSAPPSMLYKSIFALWMLSFEPEGAIYFDEEAIIQKIRDVLTYSRVEKVVRLGLTVLRNFISHNSFSVQVVELGVLESVQQLEYEKWRDADLYDEIREMSALIGSKVQEMSSFDRYERELKDGKLKWGFIHSSKFWAENVLKFEQNDFRALKMLATLLNSDDPTTLAVACHDLGDFVAMHPLGKKQIQNLGVKERVMTLMGSTQADHREVRREALLCCQKIMLNKWQEVDGAM